MRQGIDNATLALYMSGIFDLHTRLKVENGSGTPINLFGRYTRYSLNLPNPSTPIASLTVDFIRETTKDQAINSLAPTVAASLLNRLSDGITYSPLLQLGRKVVFEVALTEVSAARPADASTLWYEVFRGYITKVDWPEEDSRKASISCNDLAGILQHEKSSEPFTYAAGTTLETVAQEILTNNGFNNVVIDFPVLTGKVIPVNYTPGIQKTIWSQLWDLAQSMGWIVYYGYTGRNTLKLRFFEPAREKTDPDMEIDAIDFSSLGIDEDEVRNNGWMAFFDENGAQKLIGPYVDEASVIKYGGSELIRRPFWINLTADSPIRSEDEAIEMLMAALTDVADPDALATAITSPLVFGEVSLDLYEFLRKDRLFDSNQVFAPTAISIEETAGSFPYSSVSVRGVPTAGSGTWRKLFIPNVSSVLPTLRARSVRLSAGGLDLQQENVFVLLESPTGENVTLRVRREYLEDSTMEWALVADDESTAPLYVPSGTEVGPSHWFVDESGTVWEQLLSAVPLDPEKVTQIQLQAQAAGGAKSIWIPYTIDVGSPAIADLKESYRDELAGVIMIEWRWRGFLCYVYAIINQDTPRWPNANDTPHAIAHDPLSWVVPSQFPGELPKERDVLSIQVEVRNQDMSVAGVERFLVWGRENAVIISENTPEQEGNPVPRWGRGTIWAQVYPEDPPPLLE
jgi:hypothetical protein